VKKCTSVPSFLPLSDFVSGGSRVARGGAKGVGKGSVPRKRECSSRDRRTSRRLLEDLNFKTLEDSFSLVYWSCLRWSGGKEHREGGKKKPQVHNRKPQPPPNHLKQKPTHTTKNEMIRVHQEVEIRQTKRPMGKCLVRRKRGEESGKIGTPYIKKGGLEKGGKEVKPERKEIREKEKKG